MNDYMMVRDVVVLYILQYLTFKTLTVMPFKMMVLDTASLRSEIT